MLSEHEHIWFRMEEDLAPSNQPLSVYLLPQEKNASFFFFFAITDYRDKRKK